MSTRLMHLRPDLRPQLHGGAVSARLMVLIPRGAIWISASLTPKSRPQLHSPVSRNPSPHRNRSPHRRGAGNAGRRSNTSSSRPSAAVPRASMCPVAIASDGRQRRRGRARRKSVGRGFTGGEKWRTRISYRMPSPSPAATASCAGTIAAILQLWPTVRAALLRRESGAAYLPLRAAWPAPSSEKAAIIKSHDQGRLRGGCRSHRDWEGDHFPARRSCRRRGQRRLQ